MASPGRESPNRGCHSAPTTWNRHWELRYSAKGLVSRILFYAVIPLGAALPRTLISDLPGGFGHCMEQPFGAGPAPSTSLAPGPCFPPYLVLLRVGFTLPQPLLAARCALTAPFHPYRTGRPGIRPSGQPARAEARTARRYVFCGTQPSVSLDAPVPDVIRHTALRSSDFPLPERAKASPGSDRPVLLPEDSLPRIRIHLRPRAPHKQTHTRRLI